MHVCIYRRSEQRHTHTRGVRYISHQAHTVQRVAEQSGRMCSVALACCFGDTEKRRETPSIDDRAPLGALREPEPKVNRYSRGEHTESPHPDEKEEGVALLLLLWDFGLKTQGGRT